MLILGGCYYDVESVLYPDSDCTVPETVDYTTHVAPIIAAKCAIGSCHVSSGTAPGDLATTAALESMINDGSFQDRVIVVKDMPKSGPLPPCEILILQKWIDEGAVIN